MGFPVTKTNKFGENITEGKIRRDRWYIEEICGIQVSGNFGTNTAGTGIVFTAKMPGSTYSPYLQWKSGTAVTVTANQWVSIAGDIIGTTLGRTTLVRRIEITVDKACAITLSKNVFGNNLSGTYEDYVKYQNNASGGTVVFDFTQTPLRVECWGDILSLYIASTDTTGVKYQVVAERISISNCGNFTAPLDLGFLGDSFCNVYAGSDFEYQKTGSTETGLWTILVQRYLKKYGIETYRSNIGQGGSDISFWLNKVRMGLFRRYCPDILCINLGINDSTTTVANGTAESGLTEIITAYFDQNPTGCMVVNNITDTDLTIKLATVSSGEFSGQTFLAAIRQIIPRVITTLRAANPTWDLILANTIPANTYTSSQPTYYVETTSGSRLHPNCTLGQPAMATVINAAIATSNFFDKYKSH